MDKVQRSQNTSKSSLNAAFDRLAESIERLPQNRKKELQATINEEVAMSEKKFYTVEDLAKILKMSPLTIRRAVKAGKINAVRLGTGPKAQIRFNEEEVDRILKHGWL